MEANLWSDEQKLHQAMVKDKIAYAKEKTNEKCKADVKGKSIFEILDGGNGWKE